MNKFVVIDPVPIGDAQLVASNIIEEAPRGTSAVTYNAWSGTATYAAAQTVCHTFSLSRYGYEGLGEGNWFAIFTSKAGSNLNREPAKRFWSFGDTTKPGSNYWTMGTYAPKWDVGTTYGMGAIIGHISGATGALYQSLVADNVGNDPASEPTKWKQTTVDSYAEWSGATTYAAGEQAVILTGTITAVFTSLQAGNLNHNPATETDWWRYEGDSYKFWAASTTYAQGDIVSDPRTHHDYESLTSGNTGKDPTTGNYPTDWLDLGASNRWRCFDLTNSSKTAAGEEIDFTVQLPSLADGLHLGGMTATQVQVIATSGVTQVYNETFDLTDSAQITDWRKYFFYPNLKKAELLLTDLPFYADMLVRVIVTNPDDVAELATVTLGRVTEIGGTLEGAKVGIVDYSRVVTDDDYGDTSFTRRGYAKRGEFDIEIANDQADSLATFFTDRRATISLYAGTGDFASTWILGFYRSWDEVLATENQSRMRLEIKGIA